MKILTTTIYRDHILFEYENESGVFVVRVDFNKDNVGVRRTDNDNEIVEISEEERREWLERRDVILEKFLSLKNLYEEIRRRGDNERDLLESLKSSLDLENRLKERFIQVADNFKADYSDLKREIYRIPVGFYSSTNKK